jgi:hypothetical protein
MYSGYVAVQLKIMLVVMRMDQGGAGDAAEEVTAVQSMDIHLFVATQQRYVKTFVLTELNPLYLNLCAISIS